MAAGVPMQFCPRCGAAALAWQVPAGDDRERQVCGRCGAVHYRNPLNVCGCIAEHRGRLLLCRRSIEPRLGYWTFPAGFLETGESLVEAAVRETREEACAEVAGARLFALYNLTHIGQVYAVFRGEVPDGAAAPGAESLATDWFEADEIPWAELAFPVIHDALRLYLADRGAGRFGLHMGDIYRDANDTLVIAHDGEAPFPSPLDFRRR